MMGMGAVGILNNQWLKMVNFAIFPLFVKMLFTNDKLMLIKYANLCKIV